MIIYNKKLGIFFSNKINGQQYVSGFGTKNLGNAKIDTCQVASRLHLRISPQIVIPQQKHTTNIKVIKHLGAGHKQSFEKVDNTDGLITSLQNITLTVITGDCVPLILTDKKNNLIGISHQGWRGSLAKMAVKMIEKMIKLGAKKQNIIAAIGPSIGSCCYNIDENRAKLFTTKFNNYLLYDRTVDNTPFIERRNGKPYLNLLMLNYLQLLEAGLQKENIDYFPFCTSCDKERFFSFRRDGKKDYGEMLNFIVMLTAGV